eukprot:m51a1_g1661 hypothetical protein (82) ;mRNA; r:374092-374337
MSNTETRIFQARLRKEQTDREIELRRLSNRDAHQQRHEYADWFVNEYRQVPPQKRLEASRARPFNDSLSLSAEFFGTPTPH